MSAPARKVATTGTSPSTAAAPRQMLMPDAAWAAVLGSSSLAYFLLVIIAGTDFFVDNGGPSVTATSVWGTAVVIVVQAVPLAWRTRFPLASFIAVFAAFLATVALSIDRNLTVTPTLLFSIFSLAASAKAMTWIVTVSVASVVDLVVHLAVAYAYVGPLQAVALLSVALRVVPTYIAPVLAGQLYFAQRNRAQLASDYSATLRRASQAQASAAAAFERNRIARELHDIAAHHLTGITLQARALRRSPAGTDPATAEMVFSIAEEGEAALRSIREVVGVLRDVAGDGPPPGLNGLASLVDSVAVLYPAVDLEVRGDLGELPPSVGLAGYRIVQESLTNARKHAPGADVCISIARERSRLVISVLNTKGEGAAPTIAAEPGYGVLGMRERAEMLGGTLESGTEPGGGWRIHAVIPIQSEAA